MFERLTGGRSTCSPSCAISLAGFRLAPAHVLQLRLDAGRPRRAGRLDAALGDAGDLEMLLSLRTVADAVLVGPGTIRAEGYGRLCRPDRRPEPPPPC